MGHIENTAVNELIARGPARTALPVKLPVAAPFETTLPLAYPPAPRALRAEVAAEPRWSPPGPEPGGMDRLDPRRLHELMHQSERERMVPTFQMRRRSSEVRTVISRLVFPIALLISTGIVIGAYVAFGDHGQAHGESEAAREPSAWPPTAIESAASPAPASAPLPVASAPAVTAPVAVPAAAPVAEEAPVVSAPPRIAAPVAADTADTDVAAPPPITTATGGAGAPSLVDVRIESIPSGATVSLVDRGRTQLVGDTPIDTAVDPARAYDLVFTYGDQPPHIEHLDARATRRLAVVLDAPALLARPVDPAPRHTERSGRESAASRPSQARAKATAGGGTLMISSKPPCEIVIDGRSTGLTTPQRAIALAAGPHRITLINPENSLKKTLTVQITSDTTERIVEDLMK